MIRSKLVSLHCGELVNTFASTIYWFCFQKLLGLFCQLVIMALTYFFVSLEAAFQSMMNGGNIGKQIVSVSK